MQRITTALQIKHIIAYMVQELPSTPLTTIHCTYGSIRLLRTYAVDDAVRQGAIVACILSSGLLSSPRPPARR